jgi:CheY-like chemotaxis protein
MRENGMPLAEELHAGSGKLRVLVVDDEVAIRDALSAHLSVRTPSYEVMTASDGFEAGRLVATFRPDVVLLDLRMPGMDGFQVCRTIKADPETSSTVVIAMTGYHTPETEAKTLECGAVRCFAKPVDSATMSEFIDGLYDRRASSKSKRAKRAKN